MIYYLLPYFFSILIFFQFREKIIINKKTFLFISLFFYLLFLSLRGEVGTDYVHYQTIIDYTRNGDFDFVSYEKGFVLLTQVFLFLFNNTIHWVIVSVGILTFFVLLFTFSHNKQQYTVYLLLIAPFFLTDMTFNGLRYGLSFSLASLAVYQLYKEQQNILKFIVLSLISLSMQYSSLLIILIFFAFKFKFTMKQFVLLGLSVLVFFINLKFDLTYFLDKRDNYSEIVSPSEFSGMGPLIVFLILFCYAYFYLKNNKKRLVVLLVCVILSVYLSTITYAGLRFLNLFLFCLFLYFAFENFEKHKNFITILFIVGLLGFGLKIKNFMDEEGQNDTPFLPYKFYYENKII
ncbi:hypothetical protein B0A78_09790 [Flavobacterium columnare NBRC 100251 = ATCC 23463]|uniref:EpsG family protein n=1 Tax=Flavobacterium columnare TaxID=996 RepID=UPI000BEA3481|nr:EpsG family protein [Flavobacterium columnare]PDS23265.1 hypothetical protein B0A78_09790 [Flavobacterium columnare NBRC 100251 = ATCC 23463]